MYTISYISGPGPHAYAPKYHPSYIGRYRMHGYSMMGLRCSHASRFGIPRPASRALKQLVVDVAGRCDIGRALLADGSSQLVVYMYTDHTSMHAGRGSPAGGCAFPCHLVCIIHPWGFMDGLGEWLHGLAASGADDQRIGRLIWIPLGWIGPQVHPCMSSHP